MVGPGKWSALRKARKPRQECNRVFTFPSSYDDVCRLGLAIGRREPLSGEGSAAFPKFLRENHLRRNQRIKGLRSIASRSSTTPPELRLHLLPGGVYFTPNSCRCNTVVTIETKNGSKETLEPMNMKRTLVVVSLLLGLSALAAAQGGQV